MTLSGLRPSISPDWVTTGSACHFFIIIVIRHESTAAARWALLLIVSTLFNDAITVAVWTGFHVCLQRPMKSPMIPLHESADNAVTSWVLELEEVSRLQTVIRLCRPLQRTALLARQSCARQFFGNCPIRVDSRFCRAHPYTDKSRRCDSHSISRAQASVSRMSNPCPFTPESRHSERQSVSPCARSGHLDLLANSDFLAQLAAREPSP